jgi:DNA-binding protein YbaB
MSEQADVKSIETLALVKVALAAFAHESGQALAEVELQGQRAVDWITVDQAAYWKAETRRAADLVNKAMKDLEHCRTFKKVGDNQPSCVEEKKALDRAKQKLARAEAKAEAVRRWTPVVQQQFRETCVRLVRFREVIDVDCPKAMAQLDRMLKALDAYRSTAAPSGSTTAGGSQASAVTRQLEPAPADSSPPGDGAAAVNRKGGST